MHSLVESVEGVVKDTIDPFLPEDERYNCLAGARTEYCNWYLLCSGPRYSL